MLLLCKLSFNQTDFNFFSTGIYEKPIIKEIPRKPTFVFDGPNAGELK